MTTTPTPAPISEEAIQELIRDLEEFRREKHITFHSGYSLTRYGRAIEALMQCAALSRRSQGDASPRSRTAAQPVDERPAAWMKGHRTHTDIGEDYDVELVEGRDEPSGSGWVPLYTRPAPQGEKCSCGMGDASAGLHSDECPKAIKPAAQAMEICDECRGRGRIEPAQPIGWRPCYTCNGTGQQPSAEGLVGEAGEVDDLSTALGYAKMILGDFDVGQQSLTISRHHMEKLVALLQRQSDTPRVVKPIKPSEVTK